MTSSFHNMNSSLFAGFPWPKSALLRDQQCESSEGGITIVAMHSTAGIGTAVILCDRPSVVTTTRPQATIGLRKNSVTSLKSQGTNSFTVRPRHSGTRNGKVQRTIYESASLRPHRSQFVIRQRQIVFFPLHQNDELQQFAMWADKEIRTDLARGFIRDEDDYTSNFTGALRRNVNAYTQSGLQATSFLLSPSEERASGTDAAIILIRGGESKVALFEAKWPRFASPNYRWDSAQTASGISHFSDQLKRQKKLAVQFAVFEMFYCEHALKSQPSFLQAEGSSCTWHTDAEAFRSRRPSPDGIWDQAELQSMLTAKCLSIANILDEVAKCNVGSPIRMANPEEIAAEFGLTGRILAISSDAEAV